MSYSAIVHGYWRVVLMRSGHGCNLAALQYIEPLRGFLSELLSMLSSLMMPAD